MIFSCAFDGSPWQCIWSGLPWWAQWGLPLLAAVFVLAALWAAYTFLMGRVGRVGALAGLGAVLLAAAGLFGWRRPTAPPPPAANDTRPPQRPSSGGVLLPQGDDWLKSIFKRKGR